MVSHHPAKFHKTVIILHYFDIFVLYVSGRNSIIVCSILLVTASIVAMNTTLLLIIIIIIIIVLY